MFAWLFTFGTQLAIHVSAAPNPLYATLRQNILINADYWDASPQILGAGLGFTNILGVPGNNGSPEWQAAVIAFGGSWEILDTSNPNPPIRAFTSAADPQGIYDAYGNAVVGGGGMPVEFSWPVLPSTVDPTDFEITLNTGLKIIPEGASIQPNVEYNERSTVVLVSPDFGNRTHPGEVGAVYPVAITIIPDTSPLKLIGPNGQLVSAVGLSYSSGKPMTGYFAGPTLCAAKLSRLSTMGEGGPKAFTGSYLPNDGAALYGSKGQYRLRMLTTGGFSPDGIRSIYPTEFDSFFRIEVVDSDGSLVYLTEANKPYTLKAGSVEILGLADLGLSQPSYDDHDNLIDIILRGDESVMRRIQFVDVPSEPPYKPLYNPGGPGNNPTPGVIYSMPTSPIHQAVTIAIDNPMTVFYGGGILRPLQ